MRISQINEQIELELKIGAGPRVCRVMGLVNCNAIKYQAAF
jgi:hypothetical protein